MICVIISGELSLFGCQAIRWMIRTLEVPIEGLNQARLRPSLSGVPMSTIPKGTWVEVERTLIATGRRAAALNLDPSKAPSYTVRVSGFLLEDAELGQQVRIRTIIGKVHVGKLRIQSPSYGHSFGHTVPELLRVDRGGLI